MRHSGWNWVTALGLASALAGCGSDSDNAKPTIDPALAAQGKHIFRFDTFGDETYWTDTLRMHEVIAARRRSDDRARRSASRSTPRRCPPRSSPASRTAAST